VWMAMPEPWIVLIPMPIAALMEQISAQEVAWEEGIALIMSVNAMKVGAVLIAVLKHSLMDVQNALRMNSIWLVMVIAANVFPPILLACVQTEFTIVMQMAMLLFTNTKKVMMKTSKKLILIPAAHQAATTITVVAVVAVAAAAVVVAVVVVEAAVMAALLEQMAVQPLLIMVAVADQAMLLSCKLLSQFYA